MKKTLCLLAIISYTNAIFTSDRQNNSSPRQSPIVVTTTNNANSHFPFAQEEGNLWKNEIRGIPSQYKKLILSTVRKEYLEDAQADGLNTSEFHPDTYHHTLAGICSRTQLHTCEQTGDVVAIILPRTRR